MPLRLVLKAFRWIVGVSAGLFAILFIAGQIGWLAGSAPADLGVKDGRLKAPSPTPNSVSSQADLYPDHPQRDYARISPLPWAGSAAATLQRLTGAIEGTPGCRILRRDADYLHAACATRWLGFVDDVELWLDAPQQLVQLRSASRLGQKDFGANRARMEAIRAKYLAKE